MEAHEEVGRWYDDYAEKQLKTSVNLRHYRIMGFLAEAGLRKTAKVLEIGCGIGTLTGLLSKYLRRGKLVAVDISRESVAIARKRLASSSNVIFIISDMSDFSYDDVFDMIVMLDVLEHIPVDQHSNLFRTLADHMHAGSVILIHVPHPHALDYIRVTSPGEMLIIDQSLEADELLANAYASGLNLISYKSYSLFDKENDYAVITLRKKSMVTLQPLPKSVIIKREMLFRMKYLFSRLR